MSVKTALNRVSARDERGSDKLIDAINDGIGVADMMALITAGESPQTPGLVGGPNEGVTPLIKAVIRNRVELVKALIGLSDVNYQDEGGCTALMRAVEFHRDEIISLLLPITDTSLRNGRGESALTIALIRGVNEEQTMWDLLRALAPDQVDKKGNTLLMTAIESGGTPFLINALVDGGVEPDQANYAGESPLKLAMRLDLPEVAIAVMRRMSCGALQEALDRALLELALLGDGHEPGRSAIYASGLALIEREELNHSVAPLDKGGVKFPSRL